MTTYTPTVWADGDAITAQKLNKIENRIEEKSMLPECLTVNERCNLTNEQIISILDDKILIPIKKKELGSEAYYMDYLIKYNSNPTLFFGCLNNGYYYLDTEDDYPQLVFESTEVG